MRASVSIETAVFFLALTAALTTIGMGATRLLELAREGDPVLLLRGSSAKLMLLSLELKDCAGCSAKVEIYIPREGEIMVRGGKIEAYLSGNLLFYLPSPIENDVNLSGEGWHTITVRGGPGGVEVS